MFGAMVVVDVLKIFGVGCAVGGFIGFLFGFMAGQVERRKDSQP